MTKQNDCTCDCETSWKGIVCQYRNGCRYQSDCDYVIDNFDNIFSDVPHERSSETGSRYICEPPVMDTDEDWVLDCSKPGQMTQADEVLKKHGFFISDLKDDDYDDINENFTAYRLGHLNIVLCNSAKFYNLFVFATELAASMNILEKGNRIKLFQGILYNKIDGEEFQA